MFCQPNQVDTLPHPVVPIQSEVHGLIQKTVLHYTLDETGTKRVACEEGKCMRRTVRLRLPLNFNPETWQRHGYSMEDVIDTLNYHGSIHLWQLALQLCVQLSSSSVKLSFTSPTAMNFSSKAIVVFKIAKQLKEFYKFSATNRLDKSLIEHVPSIPVHRIPNSTYELWRQHSPLKEQGVSFLSVNERTMLMPWKDIQMLPMWIEQNGSLYLIRVVTPEVMKAAGRMGNSLASSPPSFKCQGNLYYGLVDEVGLYLPQHDI